MQELHNTSSEYQDLKRNMIAHDEETRQREDLIKHYKDLLKKTQDELTALGLDHGTLKINFRKVTE